MSICGLAISATPNKSKSPRISYQNHRCRNRSNAINAAFAKHPSIPIFSCTSTTNSKRGKSNGHPACLVLTLLPTCSFNFRSRSNTSARTSPEKETVHDSDLPRRSRQWTQLRQVAQYSLFTLLGRHPRSFSIFLDFRAVPTTHGQQPLYSIIPTHARGSRKGI